MFIDFLLEKFEDNPDRDAIVWKDKSHSYRWLLDRIGYWDEKIRAAKIEAGTVIVVDADYSPVSVALFLSLVEHGCILVPLTNSVEAKKPEFIEIARAEVAFVIDGDDAVDIRDLSNTADHSFYQELRQSKHPGLVLFSSGSTGESKAALHDVTRLLDKFRVERHSLRTIPFLLYDHIGGVNTMLYTLSNAGCLVTVQNRTPDDVLGAVERHKVELLPVSPTFVNLILLSEAYKRHDLSSLRTVTYGTEPMAETTLNRFHKLFPDIRLLQTYGLSEIGIMRTKSKSTDSLWLKVGGEGFKTRIIDGILHVKADSAMMGYLNAPSPFTDDGWLDTGDAVEVDGEYIRFLGRQSEMINVGGNKVYPVEVENVIQEINNVAEVAVLGEKNPITGNIVSARVRLLEDEDHRGFAVRLKKFCNERLEPFKVPVKVSIADTNQYSERFKKVRH